ncbi:MAG TPA: LPXTG cell wall anchor domain-containing protein, partial [Marinobacter sp.]|nr:LPXTG cell wall anchor domain-containing protein [Marinobacter sp.]
MIFGIAWFVMMWFGLVMIALVAAVMFVRRKKRHGEDESDTIAHQPQQGARQQVLEKIKEIHVATEGLRGRARIK